MTRFMIFSSKDETKDAPTNLNGCVRVRDRPPLGSPAAAGAARPRANVAPGYGQPARPRANVAPGYGQSLQTGLAPAVTPRIPGRRLSESAEAAHGHPGGP